MAKNLAKLSLSVGLDTLGDDLAQDKLKIGEC